MKALVVLLTLTITWAQPVRACSCVGKSTVNEAHKKSALIVDGTVISSKIEWLPDSSMIQSLLDMGFSKESQSPRMSGHYLRRSLVKVEQIFKGELTSDTLTIYTGVGSGDCGFRFEANRRYIIYGSTESYFKKFIMDHEYPKKEGVYWTNICTRTQAYNEEENNALQQLATD